MTDETERLTQPFVDETQAIETQAIETQAVGTQAIEIQVIGTQAIETQALETQVLETQRLQPEGNDPDVVETYVRFGPGVPVQAAPAPNLATAIWRGEVQPVETARQPAERRSRRWILPLTVLILVVAVLIYFFWGRTYNTVAVDSVVVKASTPTVTCGQTERLNALITTNGGAGTLTYQWVRSDGTDSGVLTQNMNKGEKQTSVALLWNFDGYGALDAKATLNILSPGSASGSTTFTYSCTK